MNRGMMMRRGLRGNGYGSPGAGYQDGPQPQVQNPRPIAGSGGQQTDDFFVTTVTLASLAAGATAVQNFTVQADSNFEWIMSTCSAHLDGNTDDQNVDNIDIPIVITITDSGSGRNLMNVPVPLSGIAGTGKQPFILPTPRMFLSRSTVSIVFTSQSASQWDSIFFNLIGRKIFIMGNKGA